MVNEEIRDLLNELATCQANIDNGLFRTRGHWLDERNRIATEGYGSSQHSARRIRILCTVTDRGINWFCRAKRARHAL